MRTQPLILHLSIILLFSSCKNDHKYHYAIKDFRNPLQPHLTKLVGRGFVTYNDSCLSTFATDEELERLGKAEHPILRAAAFREMLTRNTFNHFDIVINHLDDTALVFIDRGEFGISDRTVSDDILQWAEWNTNAEKTATVDLVLSKHNYLRAAYIILPDLEPQEKHYRFIKDMATRPRRLHPTEGNELLFSDIEYALYGLAKYKKKEDVAIIKEKLMKHAWRMSDVSFRFMTKFPDTAYFDVLQAYHRRQFYRFSGNRPDGFSGYPADRAAPEDFINALVAQQTDRSAQLLDTMLSRIPKHPFLPDKENITDELINTIWEHPCPAYAKIRERIKLKALEVQRGRISIEMDYPNQNQIDSTAMKFRWN